MGARSAKVQADKPQRQQDAGKIYRILAMGNWSRNEHRYRQGSLLIGWSMLLGHLMPAAIQGHASAMFGAIVATAVAVLTWYRNQQHAGLGGSHFSVLYGLLSMSVASMLLSVLLLGSGPFQGELWIIANGAPAGVWWILLFTVASLLLWFQWRLVESLKQVFLNGVVRGRGMVEWVKSGDLPVMQGRVVSMRKRHDRLLLSELLLQITWLAVVLLLWLSVDQHSLMMTPVVLMLLSLGLNLSLKVSIYPWLALASLSADDLPMLTWEVSSPSQLDVVH